MKCHPLIFDQIEILLWYWKYYLDIQKTQSKIDEHFFQKLILKWFSAIKWWINWLTDFQKHSSISYKNS